MSLLQRAVKTLGGLGLVVALPAIIFGQSTNSTNHFAPLGGEYAPVGSMLGDQTYANVSLSPSGGYMVWQDNITDGNGLGISAVQLDGTFSAKFSSFRVNVQGAGDQENPQVALLQGGGAAFVWQGGPYGFQHIYARFLSASNLWTTTTDIQVNTATNFQINPAIALLTNGNVVVTWASYGQDNADGFQGVYARIFTPTGTNVVSEFRVNQFTPFNQRTPAIAALPNGNFIVAWVSEKQRVTQIVTSLGGFANAGAGTNNASFNTVQNSVDIYALVFNSSGVAQGSEFLVNTTNHVCANPSIAVASDGGYIIAWSQYDPLVENNNSWDIYERPFSATGVGGSAQLVNSQLFGDQYAPKIKTAGSDFLVVWTSMGQDGSREGVYGQFLREDGSRAGGEQRINTTTLNAQEYPAVGSDGVGQFLVAWASYVGGTGSLDLYAQRYASTLQPLAAPGAPYVKALDSQSLSVTWPPLVGFNVAYYELFVDSQAPTRITNNNMWCNLNYNIAFNPSSTHTFQLAYVLMNGQVSPLSSVASGTTWGADANHDGLPDDWEALYYGTNKVNWPKFGAFTQLGPNVTALDVFLWGSDPTKPSTWLVQSIQSTPEGLFLDWNTVPGGIYQVLSTTDLKTWTPLGSPRFEAGTTDSLFLGRSSKGYYQIVRNLY